MHVTFLGVTANMWLSGMSVKEIGYYMGDAVRCLKVLMILLLNMPSMDKGGMVTFYNRQP